MQFQWKWVLGADENGKLNMNMNSTDKRMESKATLSDSDPDEQYVQYS